MTQLDLKVLDIIHLGRSQKIVGEKWKYKFNVYMSDLTILSIYNSCNVLGVRWRSGHLVEIVDQLSSIDNWYGVHFLEQTELADITSRWTLLGIPLSSSEEDKGGF